MNRKERRAVQKNTTEISIGTEDIPTNHENSDKYQGAPNAKTITHNSTCLGKNDGAQ